MTFSGDVNITVVDGGAAVVSIPGQQVQAVIGTAGSGTVGQVVATRSLTTLQSTFSNGPLMQAAGETLQSSLNGIGAGAVVLAVRATTATPGFINGASVAALTITGTASLAGKINVTVASTTTLISGMVVTITGVVGTTEANGTFVVTVVDPTHFSLNGSTFTNAYVSGGSAQFTGTVQTTGASAAGTSVITFTGTPTDDYYPIVRCAIGGTIGAAGIGISVSLDAGRSFGPTIAIGTATTYALKDVGGMDTGLTANFAAGTLVALDQAACSTVAPDWNTAGILIAIAALQAYAASSGGGWGSIHIPGISSAADVTTIEGGASTGLVGLSTAYIFTRAIVSARDASPPALFGGTGETAAAWKAAILLDFLSVSARRTSCAAGYYNQATAFPTAFAGAPFYRRPLAWAYAAREVAIPTQRHAGRVADGALTQIIVNAATDPVDGFVYHNEYLNPGLDYFVPGGTGRFTAARTRNGLQGEFISNPLSLAPIGSDFAFLPQGLVMDVACTIAHSVLQQFVNADLQTAANGTLLDKDATTIRNAVGDAIRTNMTGVSMISGFSVAVDQTTNMQVTKTLTVVITILGRAYVLQVACSLGFANQLAA